MIAKLQMEHLNI